MTFSSVGARSAPRLTEPSTTRRSTAAADPKLVGVTPTIAPREGVTGAPILRQLPANGSTAITTRAMMTWSDLSPPPRRSLLL